MCGTRGRASATTPRIRRRPRRRRSRARAEEARPRATATATQARRRRVRAASTRRGRRTGMTWSCLGRATVRGEGEGGGGWCTSPLPTVVTRQEGTSSVKCEHRVRAPNAARHRRLARLAHVTSDHPVPLPSPPLSRLPTRLSRSPLSRVSRPQRWAKVTTARSARGRLIRRRCRRCRRCCPHRRRRQRRRRCCSRLTSHPTSLRYHHWSEEDQGGVQLGPGACVRVGGWVGGQRWWCGEGEGCKGLVRRPETLCRGLDGHTLSVDVRAPR